MISYKLSKEEQDYLQPFINAGVVENLPDLVNEMIDIYSSGVEYDSNIFMEIDFQLSHEINMMEQENVMMALEDYWARMGFINTTFFTLKTFMIIYLPFVLQEIEGPLRIELSFLSYIMYRRNGNNNDYSFYITKPTKSKRIYKNLREIISPSKNYFKNMYPYLYSIYKNIDDISLTLTDGNEINLYQFRNCLAHNKYSLKKINDIWYLKMDVNKNIVFMEIERELSMVLSIIQLVKGLRVGTHISLKRCLDLLDLKIYKYGLK